MSAKLFKAYERHRRETKAADNALAKAVLKEYPVGRTIQYERGGHMQIGEVVIHGRASSIKVRNVNTDKVYWIDVYDVVRRYMND